jgi:ATP-binding cassette subfamily B protein
LVLDDPLSAVDAKTESAILEAIEHQKRARTVLLVTHRVAAAARCDRILVLDGGKVVDEGTHDELIARTGLYSRFAEEQAIAGALQDLAATDADSIPISHPQRAVVASEGAT